MERISLKEAVDRIAKAIHEAVAFEEDNQQELIDLYETWIGERCEYDAKTKELIVPDDAE